MQYLLLRDNREMGPYTLEELQQLPVAGTDLVWMEGRSDSWTYAREIGELQPILESRGRAEFQQASATAFPTDPTLETKYSRSLDEIKEMYVHSLYQKKAKTKGILSSQVFWMSLVAVALGAGTFFIFQYTTKPPVKQVAVKPSSEIVIPEGAAAAVSQDFKNALVTEVVDSAKLEKPKKRVDVKKQIQLEANNYKVGLLGGVNNLELIVVNNSDQFLDKVNIRVSYLKKNGEVIHSQTVSAEKIKPQDEQTISVPDYKRGVKVTYKIQSVKAQAYKGALLEV